VTRYILDTNVFTQTKNLQYGFDFCPAFWGWLLQANENRVVESVEKVVEGLLETDNDHAMISPSSIPKDTLL